MEAFPRDKETYGIPDNEMYRGYKRKKSLIIYLLISFLASNRLVL